MKTVYRFEVHYLQGFQLTVQLFYSCSTVDRSVFLESFYY